MNYVSGIHKFRLTHFALFLAVALSLFGCTSMLFDSTRAEKYEEDISTVLIGQDGETIVILGMKYHYIFKGPKSLEKILNSGVAGKIKMVTRNFHADGEAVEGEVLINQKELSISEDTAEQFKHLGFTYSSSYSFKFPVKGKRYTAKSFEQKNLKSYELSKKYTVIVEEENTAGNKAKRVALSPVTATADGVLAVVGISTLILLTPFIAPVDGVERD